MILNELGSTIGAAMVPIELADCILRIGVPIRRFAETNISLL